MRYAKWNDALLTGYPEVDEQHRALYALVNELNAESVIGQQPDAVERALHQILRYATEHFATEESLMRRSSYPLAEEHIKIHREFSQNASELAAKHLAGHGLTVREMAAFMEEWLESHIDEHDRPLIEHVRTWLSC